MSLTSLWVFIGMIIAIIVFATRGDKIKQRVRYIEWLKTTLQEKHICENKEG